VTGVATTCRDNPATDRKGCGARYSGRQIHCGLCHETFGGEGAFGLHLGVDRHGDLWHVDPRTVEKLHQGDRGVWSQPSPGSRFAALTDARGQTSPPGGGGGR